MYSIRTLFLILALVFSSSVSAVIIDPPPPAPESFLRFEENPAFTSIELKKIISLLKEGKRQEANLKIAKILAKQPGNKEALELAGVSLLQSRKYEAAEESFRRLVSQPPVSPSMISSYGIAKILNKKVNEGVKLLEQVLEYAPNDALTLRYLAWAAEADGQHGKAISYLEKLPPINHVGLQEYHVALARNYQALSTPEKTIALFEKLANHLSPPSNQLKSKASFYLTIAYAEDQQHKKAQKLANELRRYAKDEPNKLFILDIRLAAAEKDLNKAKEITEAFIKSQPQVESLARYELARAYLSNQDMASAFEELEIVLSLMDERSAVKILGSVVPLFFKTNMHGLAIDILEQQSAKYPQNDIIKYNLAQALSLSGRNIEAYKLATELLNKKTPFVSAYLLAGGIARDQENYQAAFKHLKTFTQGQPNIIAGWVSLAGVYYDQGKKLQATKSLEKGVLANPKSSSLYFELGSLYQTYGQLKKANDAFRKTLALNHNHLEAKDNLASNLLDMNQDIDIARTLAESVHAELPEDPYIQDLWGWALYRSGDFADALPHLQKAANSITNSGRADYHLALTLEKLGNTKEAKEHYQTALTKGVDSKLQKKIESALNDTNR